MSHVWVSVLNLICVVALVLGMSASPVSAEEQERRVLFYRNPMNPAITSPVPAKDSMGMDYVPVYADGAAGGGDLRGGPGGPLGTRAGIQPPSFSRRQHHRVWDRSISLARLSSQSTTEKSFFLLAR